jgi:hypothetical protein
MRFKGGPKKGPIVCAAKGCTTRLTKQNKRGYCPEHIKLAAKDTRVNMGAAAARERPITLPKPPWET